MVADEQREDPTYTLLVELLSHQFAYPVQWIKTQDVFFDEQEVARTIEIGPSGTLTGMAKQTLDTKWREKDLVQRRQRELLSSRSNAADIYYEVKDTPAAPEGIKPAQTTVPEVQAQNQQAQQQIAPADQDLASVAPLPVPDVPVSAVDILLTIVAEKLKRPVDDVSKEGTIKSLVGGRSTLENEIVGDLLSEFSSVPDRPEDLTLQALGDALSVSGGNRLGKASSGLIQRIFSSKMPGGVTANSIRDYLKQRWGFGPGRQDSILLSVISSPPSARLAQAAEANEHFDTLAIKYAQKAGLDLNQKSQQQRVAVQVNPEAAKQLSKAQGDLLRQQLKLYADSVGFDLNGSQKEVDAANATIIELQAQLDMWSAEHGDAYGSGISPKFEPKKVRTYSSYWNWALQDLLSVVASLESAKESPSATVLEQESFKFCNRATSRLVDIVQFHAQNTKSIQLKTFLTKIHEITLVSIQQPAVFKSFHQIVAPKTAVDVDGNITYSEVLRTQETKSALASDSFVMVDGLPSTQIKSKTKNGWEFNQEMTDLYADGVDRIMHDGVTFRNKTVLITGAGQNSIGAELVCGLIAGGAQVIVTTSNFSQETIKTFERLYASHGGKGSKLVLLPFNQGSQQDVESLVSYVFDTQNGLGWDLDVIIPFAAIGTAGRSIDSIDSKSELALRIMLTNVIRLLGTVKKYKANAGYNTRPTHAILPLSPNHGSFGFDALYAESKVALEALFNKWHSEDWGEYISMCGASIGWTRGTGLMNQNDIVAEGLEKAGGRTFSRQEMAINILGLINKPFIESCQEEPLYADLTGGLADFENLQGTLSDIRGELNDLSQLRRAVRADALEDELVIHKEQRSLEEPKFDVRANLQLGFPELPEYAALQQVSSNLTKMVDLERVAVIVGFGEIGPCGNARTRWEMEAFGEFTIEGCTEMAWIMGLIKFAATKAADSSDQCGWIDVETKQPIRESEVKVRYEKIIREHSGIRLLEPTFYDNYDPHKKQLMQEIVVLQDLAPIEVSKETAEDFKRQHGDKADLTRLSTGEYNVVIKKGATIMVPKAVDFRNDVAGQVPRGWNPKNYGISDDIIHQVDPITVYSLVSTVEALLSSGIVDPYEIYEYIHLSQFGNCLGTGISAVASVEKMSRDRFQEKSVQKDILQETFANTSAAWVNMLLMSSAGPTRTPVGVCATAIESLDAACDIIFTGKAKMCLVGGVDDFSEDVSFEFANMNATSKADDERAKGRAPKDMSRPTASSRAGFMESHGAGVQILATGALAIKMGLPIYGIVAYTGTASDKASRSIPAPGKGVLVNARQTPLAHKSPLLDIEYRKRQVALRRKQIADWKASELEELENTITTAHANDPAGAASYRDYMTTHIDQEAQRQEDDLLNSFGNHFWRDNTEISPIAGALATWGLTIDDLDVASFHGTSTKLNDINESAIIQNQLRHLGRSKGNPIYSVFQKHLTGHPKGAAGAWMLNGCLQILRTGLVPGNRNCDNLDDSFQEYDLIAYPNRAIQTKGVRAFSVTCFGFGQKGAQTIGVHSDYLLAMLTSEQYEEYCGKVKARKAKATSEWIARLLDNSVVQLKDSPPNAAKDEIAVLLNPGARFGAKK